MRRVVWRLCGSAMVLVAWTVVHAQPTIHHTFDDGVLRGTPTKMQVAPKILTEDGESFMRITGSPGDKQAIPSTYPHRNRSTVAFTPHFSNMPLLTPANMRQTYSADLRFQEEGGSNGVVFELFQAGQRLGGYGTKDGQGPVVIFWRDKGHVWGAPITSSMGS